MCVRARARKERRISGKDEDDLVMKILTDRKSATQNTEIQLSNCWHNSRLWLRGGRFFPQPSTNDAIPVPFALQLDAT